MKEYNIKINFVVEAQDSDYDRVEQYAQELADAIMQDVDITYDEDIEVIEISVDNVQNLSNYDVDSNFVNDDDEDSEQYI